MKKLIYFISVVLIVICMFSLACALSDPVTPPLVNGEKPGEPPPVKVEEPQTVYPLTIKDDLGGLLR